MDCSWRAPSRSSYARAQGRATTVDDRCWRSVQRSRRRGARGADVDAKPESRVAIQTYSRAEAAFQTIPRN